MLKIWRSIQELAFSFFLNLQKGLTYCFSWRCRSNPDIVDNVLTLRHTHSLTLKIKIKKIYLYFRCIFVLAYLYVHHMHACAQGVQRRVSDPPRTGVISVCEFSYVSAGNQAWVLRKNSQCF